MELNGEKIVLKNKRSLGKIILITCGILLVTVSVSILSVSLIHEKNIKIDCTKTVAYIEEMLPVREAGIKEDRSNNEMPCISYDGQDYVALLSVPECVVNFPVRASWDTDYIKKVPCCFDGNPYDGSLVIGGYDSEGQFDFVSTLDNGDLITITDMTGTEFTYTVSVVRHSDNANAETLMDKNYDLTLFTKDRQTERWLLVRCNTK